MKACTHPIFATQGKTDACFAYFSFATQNIDIPIEPPMTIPMGEVFSARVRLFGWSLGLKMTRAVSKFILEMSGTAIRVDIPHAGELVIAKSKNSTLSPELVVEIDASRFKLAGRFEGYIEVPFLGDATFKVNACLTHTQQSSPPTNYNILLTIPLCAPGRLRCH